MHFKMNYALRSIAALIFFAALVAGKLISVNREYDQDTAASDHHYGRVHIKVFRGPGHEHHFAPHGYWIKQPADDHHDGK
ncbi:ADP-ribosylation factor family [Nesidiocoris tenuis]|uniref:ADP-ribosylation factor family n=1 Tax=Nesidiocoris tenuis TaxID=355587 RepID=A0ABN7B2X5_9HEMI|nr:ADP-ribosylation factor family [Nesidiocoris tenuis]